MNYMKIKSIYLPFYFLNVTIRQILNYICALHFISLGQ